MAELDYAFIADYAAVIEGKLTAVGASYTHVRALSLPALHSLSVAGRVRSRVGDDPVRLEVKINPPGGDEFVIAALLDHDGTARPYGDNRIGLLFAANVAIPLLEPGLCVVTIGLDDDPVRRLAFSCELADE